MQQPVNMASSIVGAGILEMQVAPKIAPPQKILFGNIAVRKQPLLHLFLPTIKVA